MTALLHPTTRDLQAWRSLCRQALSAAADPAGPGGDLRAAGKRASKAVAPSHEALKTFCAPLVRLAQAWAAMDGPTRGANAASLTWLAEGLGPLVGFDGKPPRGSAQRLKRPLKIGGEPGLRLGLHLPVETPEPTVEREPRRDIWG